MSKEELKQYDGSDKTKPILLAVKKRIYDVSRSETFYGPGTPYAVFAGKDASRGLAKNSTVPEDVEKDNIDDLTGEEKSNLEEWATNYETRYPFVGLLKD